MFDTGPIVVIGCSHGGVTALRALTRAFDPRWRASIFITIHIGPGHSRLPELLGPYCPLPLAPARDRELIERGHVYVAPPDRHLYIEPAHMRLCDGPYQNWTRPAIDPMFRSAAHHHAPCVVGILLTGSMRDGVDGLHEIQDRGGCTIVQDPAEAMSPDLPRNAINQLTPDYVLRLRGIPDAIGECLADMPSFPRYDAAAPTATDD